MRQLGLVSAVAALLWSGGASAYPWMVKHTYSSCAACHVDPSGSGQLTSFGRTESERLVQWKPGEPPAAQGLPKPTANFLWFLELPEAVNLSGNVRFGMLLAPGAPKLLTPLEMAADLSATFTLADLVIFHGTGGFGRGDAIAPAIVAPACDPSAEGQCGASFLARTFWAGLKLAEGAVLVRGGRLPVPFGLRNVEHDTYVRALTRTDVNVQQKLGVSAAYNSGNLRAEVMGLAGATLPTEREGGYSGYLEYSLTPTTALGFSSLVANATPSLEARADPYVTRHAHGAFLRWGLSTKLAILAEADFLAWIGAPQGDRVGYAALAQADYELTQGLHLMLTAESGHRGLVQHGPSLGAWASVAWYVYSHFELRLDNVLRKEDGLNMPTYALVAQLHFYL